MTKLFTMENIESCLAVISNGSHPAKSLGTTRQVELSTFSGNYGVFELWRTDNDRDHGKHEKMKKVNITKTFKKENSDWRYVGCKTAN